MSEIIFLVEPAPEGGYMAQALGYSIFTEADTWDELKIDVQDAVPCTTLAHGGTCTERNLPGNETDANGLLVGIPATARRVQRMMGSLYTTGFAAFG